VTASSRHNQNSEASSKRGDYDSTSMENKSGIIKTNNTVRHLSIDTSLDKSSEILRGILGRHPSTMKESSSKHNHKHPNSSSVHGPSSSITASII
jgi:hypothetical protein